MRQLRLWHGEPSRALEHSVSCRSSSDFSVWVPHKVLPCRCFSVSSTVFTVHTTWDANLSTSLWIIPLIHRCSVAPTSKPQLLRQQYLPTGKAQLTFQHACVWTHSFPQYTFSSGSLLLLNGICFLFILLKVIYAFPSSFTCHSPPHPILHNFSLMSSHTCILSLSHHDWHTDLELHFLSWWDSRYPAVAFLPFSNS